MKQILMRAMFALMLSVPLLSSEEVPEALVSIPRDQVRAMTVTLALSEADVLIGILRTIVLEPQSKLQFGVVISGKIEGAHLAQQRFGVPFTDVERTIIARIIRFADEEKGFKIDIPNEIRQEVKK